MTWIDGPNSSTWKTDSGSEVALLTQRGEFWELTIGRTGYTLVATVPGMPLHGAKQWAETMTGHALHITSKWVLGVLSELQASQGG